MYFLQEKEYIILIFGDPQIRKAIHEWLPLQSAGRVAGL